MIIFQPRQWYQSRGKVMGFALIPEAGTKPTIPFSQWEQQICVRIEFVSSVE